MLEGLIPSLKRVLITVAVLTAFLLVIFYASPAALAQPVGFDTTEDFENNTGGGPTNPYEGLGPGDFPVGGIDGIGGVGSGSGGTGSADTNGDGVVSPDEAIAADAGTQTAETPVLQIQKDCWKSPEGVINCMVVSFFGAIAGITGSAFDSAIDMFIVNFGKYYLEYGVGYVVEDVWGTLRDIFNLTFIFGLVYIGFQIILGVNESSAKRTIPLLIMAALLINFSLFTVKFVVDFSNLAAVQIYNLFEVTDTETPGMVTEGVAALTAGNAEKSIALAFTNQLGVTALLNSYSPSGDMTGGVGITYMFTMIIIFLVLTYVFLAGAILITIRFAVLIFYMIFSPVMFLGWVFPGLAGQSRKFWHGLIGQAFFAPALLFMLYISYRVMQGFNDGKRVGGEVIAGDENGAASDFAIFIPYLIINVVFIFGSLIVAKKMGSFGADSAVSIGHSLRGRAQRFAGNATAGMLGGLGRSTIGAGAYALKNNDGFKDRMARGGRLGKMVYGGVGKVADSSFDARKVGDVGKKMGIGEGRKGGYTTIMKEEKESDEKFLKELGTRKFEESAEAIRLQKGITALASNIGSVTDESQRAHMQQQIVNLQTEYDARKKEWGSEQEYARQLSYIDALEKWGRFRASMGAGVAGAGLVGAGILTGGILAPGIGAIAGGGAAAKIYGNTVYSRATAKALRKDYGKDGSAKKKKDGEEKGLKAAMAAFGLEAHKADHDKKEGAHATPHTSAPAKPAAAPKAAAPSGGGGGHDHGH